MADFRKRLSANAEEFDGIVAEILAENEQLRFRAETAEERVDVAYRALDWVADFICPGTDIPFRQIAPVRPALSKLLAPAGTSNTGLRHAFKPNTRFPWFCAKCGYPEHEDLKHLPREGDEK